MSDGLIIGNIPNLINGVSQQAPSLRRASQCESQSNCRNDPVDGMGKRFNSELIAELTNLTSPENYVIEYVDRDEIEKYIFAVTNGDVKVYDQESGFEYTVAASDDALTYLASRGDVEARRAFQLLNTIDTTLILNKTVPAQFLPADTDTTPPSVSTERRYTFSIAKHKYPHYDNTIDPLNNHTYWYEFTVDGTTHTYADARAPVSKIAKWLEGKIASAYPTALQVQATSTGVNVTVPSSVTVDTTGVWKYRQYIVDTEGGGTTDKTFSGSVVSKKVQSSKVTAPSPAVPAALWYVKQADYHTTYEVVLNGTKCAIETPESTSEQARAGLETTTITADMKNAINAKTGTHGCSATQYGNVLYITHNSQNDFTIKSRDDLGDRGSYAIKEYVESFEDLPPEAPTGFRVEVRGAPDVDVDPYHVQFKLKTEDDVKSTGYWKEVAKHGIATELDPRSLPHGLVRKQDESYVSSDNVLGIYFELEELSWAERTVGDDVTAPMPSFISEQDADGHVVTPRHIKSMSYHRNRLAFCSDENIIFSETGQYLNFFPTTVTTVLDADPIDIALSLNSVAPVEHMLEVEQGLMLYAPRQQILLTGGDVFNTASLNTDVVSRFDMDMNIEPLAHGPYVYFWSSNLRNSQLWEHAPNPDGESWDAVQVTSHVPTYVSGKVRRSVGSTIEKAMFFPAMDVENKGVTHIYAHNYLYNGREKVQNAWQKWEFSGEVVDVTMKQDELFLVVYYPDEGKSYLEKITLSYDRLKAELGHSVFLDRREEVDNTYILPENDPRELHVFQGRYFVGFPYDMKMTLSQFFPRDNDKAVQGGHLQLHYLELHFNETTYFSVEITRQGRASKTVQYTGRRLGSLNNLLGVVPVDSGKKKVPIHSRSDNVQITVINDSVFDSVFQTADWEALYVNRARRT